MLIRSLFITFLRTHLYSILAWKFSSHLILVCVPAGQTLLKPSKILISILFKTAATCQSLLIKAAHKLEQRKHSGSTQKAYYIMTPGYKGSNVERKEKKKENEKKKKNPLQSANIGRKLKAAIRIEERYFISILQA